jgi:two-component system, NarL family, sensor histidine kinase EvgS
VALNRQREVVRLPSLTCRQGAAAVLRSSLLVMLLAVGLAWSSSAHAQSPAQPLRFRTPAAAAPALSLGPQVLTEEERAFIAQLPELRVAITPSPIPPYESVSASGEVAGIQAEMLVPLAKAFGLRIRPVMMSDWPATLNAVRDHEADIVLNIGVTPPRLEYIAFTLGTAPRAGGWFGRRGVASPPFESARIAVEREYATEDVVRREYPAATLVLTTDTPAALEALRRGDADYYLGSLLEVVEVTSQRGMDDIELRHLAGIGTGYYHFGVRKDWAPLATILNKGILSLYGTPGKELSSALSRLPAGAPESKRLPLSSKEAALLAGHAVWRVGAVRGLAMLNEVDANGTHSGIAAEYTEQVARRLGAVIQVVAFDNVAAMLDALRDGRIDIVPFLTRTPEREKLYAYSASYVEMPYVIVARNDAPLYWSLDSLRGQRLALAQQHPLRPMLAQRYADIEIVDAADGREAMELVAKGRADAAVEVKLFANLRIASDHIGTLRAVTTVDDLPAQFQFAAARSRAELLPLVDRALADIPAQEHTRMQRRWIAIDARPPEFPWRRYLPVIGVSLAALLMLALITAWWMRRLSREVAARRQSETLLSDIASTAPGVSFRYVISNDGRLVETYVSPACKQVLGVDPPQHRSLAAALADRMPPESAATARAQEQRSLAAGEPFEFNTAYLHPDGSQRRLYAKVVRTGEQGNCSVWTGFVFDVTAEHTLQQQVASEARRRSLLLASASHELRAPTHTLSLALQSLPDGGLNAQQQEALCVAQEATRTLAMLINDVLDTARLDIADDTLRLHPQTVDPRALAHELAQAWGPVARSKQIEFKLELAPDVPATAVLDPLRVKQVLTNLLSNACKYTQQGRVVLRAEMIDAALRFAVADTGIGIPPQQIERVFQPFETLDDAAVQAGSGGNGNGHNGHGESSGLGLSICRRMAQFMGARLIMQSEPGRGTTVILVLPEIATRPASVPPPLEGSVLVCDDDPTGRMLMTHMLLQAGYRAEGVAEGQAALQRWRRGDVAVLVTDLHMPGIGGSGLVRAVRDAEAGNERRTRIVVCSGADPVDPLAREALAWQDAAVPKPVNMNDLVGTLKRLGLRPDAPLDTVNTV